MKVAVVGSGGREHALVTALSQSPKCSAIVAMPGNGGMAGLAECVDIKAADVAGIVAYCAQNGVDYVVVAPEDPLALGLVDALAEVGIPAFGPSAAAARIEASKVFSKALMENYGIPTAAHKSFTQMGPAMAYILQQGRWPVVVKADGLATGKGVLICQNEAEAENALKALFEERRFGAAGASVVVEEFLTGPEVSVLAFCDGEAVVPMLSSMDHKRIYDGDKGPNTGGMGAIAPNPFYTPQMAARCMEEIFLPTMRALAAESAPFKGCLYFGLMLCADGPKVIEYNCRFGDPETQVVLPLLESDLLEIMLACTEGRLTPGMVRFAPGAAACVVIASGGYPGAVQVGFPIKGLAAAEGIPGVHVYHAGTRQSGGQVLTAGGRVLGVAAGAPTLQEALALAYQGVAEITFEGAQYRTDIGKVALEAMQ
ncbi:phosphoribosylamine--glycine ligase [Ruminococcaceae bacterium OttesenSCG-928-O06]|nr:phosphoribosylamine--glycine ligase [Ruminococcaceae bacterium OttesenSCG-928-O06]